MKRAVLIPIFVLGILLPGYLYLGYRLASEVWIWLLIAIPFFLIATFPLHFGAQKNVSGFSFREFFFHSTLFAMGALSFLFVITLGRDLIWLAAKAFNVESAQSSASEFIGPSTVAVLTVLTLVAGYLIATQGLRVRKVKVPIANLPQELEGFKIVQISDLHVGPTIGKKYVEKIVRKANAEKAQIVALTGDIADGHLAELKEHIEPLRQLQSTHGIFYVPGNHEYYWNINGLVGKMKQLGAHVLLNQGEKVLHRGRQVLIGGITDPVAAQLGSSHAPNLEKPLLGFDDADLKILLSHRPGFAEKAAALGYQLQLSGHTHGGQFFPWTIVVRFVHKYSWGLAKCGSMWIYVSVGTGSWGPLIRLGTAPELTVLTLTKA